MASSVSVEKFTSAGCWLVPRAIAGLMAQAAAAVADAASQSAANRVSALLEDAARRSAVEQVGVKDVRFKYT